MTKNVQIEGSKITDRGSFQDPFFKTFGWF